jgi:hypothetical protein
VPLQFCTGLAHFLKPSQGNDITRRRRYSCFALRSIKGLQKSALFSNSLHLRVNSFRVTMKTILTVYFPSDKSFITMANDSKVEYHNFNIMVLPGC